MTSAQFLFDSESKLREAIQKMLEPKGDKAAADTKNDEMADEELEALFE
ncbi:MAG: hypothetical protein R2864_05150 [Syntrophotaleaceae bacterium]